MSRTKQWLLALCISISLFAQAVLAQNQPNSLQLEQALARAYRNNPGLWQLRQEQALWQARIVQAKLGPNPELSLVSEDFVGSAAFTSDRFTQFTLSIGQTLLLGNKLENRTQLAELSQLLAYWDYRIQVQQVGFEIYQGYIRLVNLDAEENLAKDLLANALLQHTLMERAVQAGRLAPAALLQSQTLVKEFEAECFKLALEAKRQRQKLALLWGADKPDFEYISGHLPLDGLGDWEQLESRLQSHPRLARWQIEEQQREQAFHTSQSQAVPDVSFSGALRYHPPFDWGAVLSLGLPLPIANSNQGNIEEARMRHASWQRERELEERTLKGQLRSAYEQAHGQEQLAELLKAQMELAKQQQAIAAKAFEAGKTNYLDLLLATRNLEQLRRRWLQAQGERLLAISEVLFFTQDLMPEPKLDFSEPSDDLHR